MTMVFLIVYKSVGDTTARGWLATVAAAFELSGVLLIASPELRPIIERVAVRTWHAIRRLTSAMWSRLRRLLHIRRIHVLDLGAAVETNAAIGIQVNRGHDPPPADATLEVKVTYLLAQERRHLQLIEGLENRVQREMEGVSGELAGTAAELREHTAASVREVAEAELRMRLVGVEFVVAGIAFAYATNLV